jgi:hypothetical protein
MRKWTDEELKAASDANEAVELGLAMLLDIMKERHCSKAKLAEAAAKAKVRAYVNKYVKEDEEEMQEKTMWYAVQEERTDAWDFGSHDYEEAVRMLKEQGHGLIAVIDEKAGFCVKEIEYADAVNE